MEDSVTYQAILMKGRIAQAQAMLPRWGNQRFGPPSAEARTCVEGITSIERLEALIDRMFDLASWDELLAE